MNIFHLVRCHIIDAIESIAQEMGLLIDTQKVTVEAPKDASHGDLASNAAMVCAKSFGITSRALAEKIGASLISKEDFVSFDIAGPGFLNLRLNPSLFHAEIFQILEQGIDYGSIQQKNQIAVLVEMVSANPTGPIHAGHGRNAILGDAIAALFEKTGYKVVREYYVNDAGGQVNHLARSVYLRYGELHGEKLPDNAFDGDLYPGDYVISIAQKIKDEFSDQFLHQDESVWLNVIRARAVADMMDLIRIDLEKLGVHIDSFRSERAVTGAGYIDKTLEVLTRRDDIYVGVLTPPKGHTVDDWEERPQTLFRSTKYGDDVDRALKKSDGSWTYFAGDLGYHYDKYDRGFTKMINIFGADHAGYVKRLSAAVKAMTNDEADFEIKVSQMVNFMENGLPVRMSKRAGNFITVSDVIERVGLDSTRFMMISRHNDMSLDFDFQKVIEQSRDNPIFYIQYAHARIHSVLRHASDIWPQLDLKAADLTLLIDHSEFEIIKLLSSWPRHIEVATQTREPHRLANFLYDLAGAFHALWNKGKENTALRFIDAQQPDVTLARLALLQATAFVIASGLTLFGITPVKELRS